MPARAWRGRSEREAGLRPRPREGSKLTSSLFLASSLSPAPPTSSSTSSEQFVLCAVRICSFLRPVGLISEERESSQLVLSSSSPLVSGRCSPLFRHRYPLRSLYVWTCYPSRGWFRPWSRRDSGRRFAGRVHLHWRHFRDGEFSLIDGRGVCLT